MSTLITLFCVVGFLGVTFCVLLLPVLSAAVRRINDAGKPKWIVWLILLCFLGLLTALIAIAWLCCIPTSRQSQGV